MTEYFFLLPFEAKQEVQSQVVSFSRLSYVLSTIYLHGVKESDGSLSLFCFLVTLFIDFFEVFGPDSVTTGEIDVSEKLLEDIFVPVCSQWF